MDPTKNASLLRSFVLITTLAVFGSFVLVAADEDEEEWKRRDTIAANLSPFGKLCLVGEDCGSVGPLVLDGPRGTGLSGKGVYDKYCYVCHDEGLDEAPLVASEDWEPRVAQGYDVLLQHTKEGFNKLPPMGTCVDCTDEELEAAIRYLITGEEESDEAEENEEDSEDG